MIQEFVERWEERKGELRERFSKHHPEDYLEIVRAVVEILVKEDNTYPRGPDPDAIEELQYGGYSGQLLYIIASDTRYPSLFWYVRVNYGSCSGCDALYAIRNYDEGPPNEKQTDGYMTLALHIVQKIKKMEGEKV